MEGEAGDKTVLVLMQSVNSKNGISLKDMPSLLRKRAFTKIEMHTELGYPLEKRCGQKWIPPIVTSTTSFDHFLNPLDAAD